MNAESKCLLINGTDIILWVSKYIQKYFSSKISVCVRNTIRKVINIYKKTSLVDNYFFC